MPGDRIKRAADFTLLREVAKGQGELRTGQLLIEQKVDMIYRSINVDNGEPCIKTRLRCNEKDIIQLTSDINTVKVVATSGKNVVRWVIDGVVVLSGLLVAFKTIGLIK